MHDAGMLVKDVSMQKVSRRQGIQYLTIWGLDIYRVTPNFQVSRSKTHARKERVVFGNLGLR